MAILTHCPNCSYSIGPRDTQCPRCGTPIQRHTTGTVAFTRPVYAFLEIATGGYGTPRSIPLVDAIPVYTIGRAPASNQSPNLINVDSGATAVAAFHARIHLDNRDPTLAVWRLEDLRSPNGSYRNNQRMAWARLDDGDEIWLGPVGGPTSVRLIYHDPIERPPVKRWLLHPGGHNPLKVGRNVGPGHLRLFGENASDHHATITKVTNPAGTSYELSDAASSNGTFVNNMQLVSGQSVALKQDDMVRFGKAQYSMRRIDASRMIMLPLGVEADEHIVGHGLYRTVTIEANMWASQYVRYLTKRTFNPGASRQFGATLTPPQRKKVLLQDVDIVVGPNDFIVLAGSSGSGKSTLMHILSTFIYPQAGGLFYKGREYKDNPHLLRPQMGYVPQDDIIHEQLTVFEELLYAAELRLPATFTAEERESRVHAVLKQLRLVPQTRQRINRLSGGQRKRVSIAVELLNRPGILFLDEPTEGQDLALEQSLIIMLRNLANDGTSIVLISHRLNFLDYADYVGWLAPGGHLVYFGPPDQVSDYFGVNPDFSPAQRYAAVYDKLDDAPDPARLAADFKRSAHYQEFIQARLQVGSAHALRAGPLSTGAISTQQLAALPTPLPAVQRQQPAMHPPSGAGQRPVVRVPASSAQTPQRPSRPPMPGITRNQTPTPGKVSSTPVSSPPRQPQVSPSPPPANTAPPAQPPSQSSPLPPPPPPPAQGAKPYAPPLAPPQSSPLPPPPAPPGKSKGGAVPAAQKLGSWTTSVSAAPQPLAPPPAPPAPSPYAPPPGTATAAPVMAPAASPVPQQQVMSPPPMAGSSPYPAAMPMGAPSYPAQYAMRVPQRRRPQFGTLLRRDKSLVQSDWSFLVLMVVQPFVIGLLLSFLSEPNMFTDQQLLAQTVLFSMSVSAVYLGVLLSMRELVKERGIYRRERMVGLRLGPYFLSKISVLSFFSLYQSFVLVLLVLLKAPAPSGGALFWAPFEMFFTLFLTAFGGMSLGLLLSAFARTQEVLGALVPMVMIPQFVLSKVVISLPGFLDPVSRLMFTNWATEAMGDSVGLTRARILPNADPNSMLDYSSTAGHLLLRWLVLIGLSLLFLGLAWLRQKQRDKFQG
jgi:ABC-type multidrug transport system ATPase subunit/pSer/pThr/pTyr-binding forkhead associated (FHA) protein